MNAFEISDVLKMARELYPEGPVLLRYMQYLRPYICPYAELINHISICSKALDVGCGSGLFLGLLAVTKKIQEGIGFDASKPAIDLAQLMINHLPEKGTLRFHYCDAKDPWPKDKFDLISLIDIMHHVQPKEQKMVFRQASQCLSIRGQLLYKDMGIRPYWKSFANRLHDLLIARQWIHYVPIEQIIEWGRENGLVIKTQKTFDVLWYRHEMVIFKRI
jgi:cyclopropane fatty-acyl-phospholipid synthase-like methyltransferase